MRSIKIACFLSVFTVPVVSQCRVKKCWEKDVHGCSNIADLNTGLSLQSSPVLGEEKTISGNPVGNPSEPSRDQKKRIVNNK